MKIPELLNCKLYQLRLLVWEKLETLDILAVRIMNRRYLLFLQVSGATQLSIEAAVSDSDFQNILVYRTGIPITQELVGGDFNIADAEIAKAAGDVEFTDSGIFQQDFNKKYYYKLLPVDTFGTGVTQSLTGEGGGLLAFSRELKITNLHSFADEKGNFSFFWDLKDSVGVCKYC